MSKDHTQQAHNENELIGDPKTKPAIYQKLVNMEVRN